MRTTRKTSTALCGIFLPVLLSGACLAMIPRPVPAGHAAVKAASADALTAALQKNLAGVEREFVATADAMPADQYSFAPSPAMGDFQGVRSFAQQVAHVAAVNNQIFAALLGEKLPDAGAQENGPSSLKTKAQIMKYLRDSFALGHRAMAAIDRQNALERLNQPFGPMTRLQLAAAATNHINDHYGQMVVYLRMNHIIPPSSRPRK